MTRATQMDSKSLMTWEGVVDSFDECNGCGGNIGNM